MNQPRPHRGGAPVGYVAELDAIEASAVRYLRLWRDGPESKAEVCDDFSRDLGAQEDAMMIATILVRADMAPSLVGLAQSVGLALKRMTLRTALAPAWVSPQNQTYH